MALFSVPMSLTECELPLPKGYISNAILSNDSCGTFENLWLLESDPGQKFKITLFNFTPLNSSSSSSVSACNVLAHVKEATGVYWNRHVCDSINRVTEVFTSAGNKLEVSLQSRLLGRNPNIYLLHYASE
jgi:hypothetical protein